MIAYKCASNHVSGEVADSDEEPEEAELDGGWGVLVDVAVDESLKLMIIIFKRWIGLPLTCLPKIP
jgi:hypothetical protein